MNKIYCIWTCIVDRFHHSRILCSWLSETMAVYNINQFWDFTESLFFVMNKCSDRVLMCFFLSRKTKNNRSKTQLKNKIDESHKSMMWNGMNLKTSSSEIFRLSLSWQQLFGLWTVSKTHTPAIRLTVLLIALTSTNMTWISISIIISHSSDFQWYPPNLAFSLSIVSFRIDGISLWNKHHLTSICAHVCV